MDTFEVDYYDDEDNRQICTVEAETVHIAKQMVSDETGTNRINSATLVPPEVPQVGEPETQPSTGLPLAPADGEAGDGTPEPADDPVETVVAEPEPVVAEPEPVVAEPEPVVDDLAVLNEGGADVPPVQE